MNSNERSTKMDIDWEDIVQEAAAQFDYPQTPDIAVQVVNQLSGPAQNSSEVLSRRLAWTAVAAVLIFALVTLASPNVRAAIRHFFQFGAVRIEMNGPTTTPPMLQSVLDLTGETDLVTARAKLSVPLRLPTYPVDLGEPDQVFVEQAGSTSYFAHLIWLDHAVEGQVQMSLMILEPDALVTKVDPASLIATTVHGAEALWTDGPYALLHRSGGTAAARLIDGHVLIWTEEINEQLVTHRLETNLSLEEAVRIAESLE